MSRPTRAEWLDAIIAVSREWHGIAPGEGTVYADRVEPLLDRVDAVVDALMANNQAMHDGLVSAIALQREADAGRELRARVVFPYSAPIVNRALADYDAAVPS